jgi:hypothetical protein
MGLPHRAQTARPEATNGVRRLRSFLCDWPYPRRSVLPLIGSPALDRRPGGYHQLDVLAVVVGNLKVMLEAVQRIFVNPADEVLPDGLAAGQPGDDGVSGED